LESSEAERKGRSGAEVCTSDARKTAGNPLRRAIGAEPLARLVFLIGVRQHAWIFGVGVAGRNEVVYESRKR
jgi:hypothetical protein